jgi:hypothetical protein
VEPATQQYICKLQKGCTRLTATSDQISQLLSYGRWFSPRTPAPSTTKTGRMIIIERGKSGTRNTTIHDP